MKKFTFISVLFLFAVYFQTVSAQLSNYNFSSAVEVYSEISGGIVLGNESTDDEVFVDPANPGGQSVPEGGPGFPIGFSFTFNGTVFNRLGVDANGWIALGSDSFFPAVGLTSTYSFFPLASTVNFLHPEWVSRVAGLTADLLAQPGATIRLQTIGAAPNRVCVVQWKNYRPYLSGNGDSFNFQIRLHETSNSVSIVYGAMVKNSGTMQATVGMRGAPANVVTNYAVRTTQTNWQTTQAGATVDEFCLVSPGVIPPSGLTFSYTLPQGNMPPNCAQIPLPVDGSTGLTNNVQLSWGNGGENPTGYRLYLGTDNPPTNLINGNDLGNITTYSPGLLEYSTTYFWKVVAYNQFGDAVDCPVWSFTLMDNPAFVSFPFIESFEEGNVNESNDIFRWTQELVGNTDEYWQANTTNPNFRAPRTGNFNIILYTSGHTWLFRPFYFTGGVNYNIELWARQSSANFNCNVGIYMGLQPNGASMTTTIAAQQGVTSGEYQKVSGSFSVEESGIFYIGIRGVSSNTLFHLSLDDILINEADFCNQPTNLQVSNITSNSALLDWTQIGEAALWNIEWGEAGFVPGTGNMIQNTPNKPYNLSGLELGTTYDFYVQAVCNANNLSEWNGPGSFTTKSCIEEDECEYTFILLDDFGDGWDGATMQVISGGSVVKVLGTNFTNGDDYTEYHSFCHDTGFEVFFNNGGDYPQEVGLKILDFMGETVFLAEGYNALEVGTIVFEGAANCMLPVCLKPIDLNAVNITSSGADLSWTALNGEITWNLEWGALGFAPGTGTLLESISSNPYSLVGLSEGTLYDFYVQAICEGGVSDWVGPFSFQTIYNICDPYTLPFNEDFDGETFPPTCWMPFDMDFSGTKWESSDLFNHTQGGSQSAVHAYANATHQDGWLISPPLNLADYTMFRLSFWSLNAYASYYEKNSVLVSAGSPNPSDGDFVEIWSAPSVVSNWEKTEISLDAFAGQTIYIAFRYEGINANSWFLDDVSVNYLTEGSLSGYVTSATNQPIQGARVFAGSYESFTDATGYYEFPAILAGVYDFTCEAEGFLMQIVSGVEIFADQTANQDFVLDFAQITVNPLSLNESLEPGGSSVQQLTVSNPAGTADLEWQAYFIYQEKDKGMKNNIQYPILWDNTLINPSNTGTISVELTGLVPDGRIISADDFIVPSEEMWEIRYIYTEGFSSQSTLPDAFKIAIYQNSNNEPGELLFVEQIVPDDLNFDTQHLYFNNPVVLPTGHYWLSVYAVYVGSNGAENTRWNWSVGSADLQNHAKLHDYAGYFGSPGWKNVDSNPSCYFKIGGYVNSWLSLSNINGTVQPGQSQTIDVNFNAGFLADGVHEAEIRFVHNGQEVTESELSVPVFLTVAATLPPQQPSNPVPADGDVLVTLQPVFEWTNGVGTAQSKIRIEQVSFPNNILIHETGFFTGNSFDLASVGISLLPKTEYRWMVTCKNAIGETAGEWWYFESIGAGTISGLVTDAYTNLPLQGVTITAGANYQTATLAAGYYNLPNVVEGVYEVTATFDGYLSQSQTIEIIHGADEIVNFNLSLALKPPYGLKAEISNIFDVNLTWNSPETGSEEWLYYHDGSFENALASETGMFGLAQLFTPEEYPCQISKVRYFNDGFGAYQEHLRVYVLSGDGATILAGPYFVTNGPANDWVTVEVNPVTINSGNFMVATINSNPGGPLVAVDNSLYNGTLFYGSIGNFTELGNLGYYYVGSHEAFVTYSSGGKMATNSVALTPRSVDKSVFAANLAVVAERKNITPAPSKAGETLLGYNLYRNDQFVTFTDQTNYTDLNLAAGQYTYIVKAVYTEGESVPSLPAAVGILSPPVMLFAEQQGAEIHLAWESKFTGLENNPFDQYFVLYRNGVKLGEFTETGYIDNDILPGGNYCYTVLEAVTEDIETGLSNEICVGIPLYGILASNPASLSEVHTNGESLTSQILLLTNTGAEPVDFNIEKEYIVDSKASNLKSSGFCSGNLYSFGCSGDDGIIQWELANIDIHVPCEGSPSWYQDFTNLTHELEPGGTYQLKIMARSWDTYFSVWIDFDDDKTLTQSETIVTNAQITLGYTWYTCELTIPEDAPVGTFGMRMRSRTSQPVNDACQPYSWGNCADFMVTIGNPWLDVSPKAGTIQPGESFPVEVTFNSSLLDLGTYNANLKINTNNPFISQPELEVPAELVVTESITQQILLPMGWSGWSSYVDLSPENAFADVVAPVLDDLIISTYFYEIFYPAFNINTMSQFSNQHGYIIKMAAERMLTFEGMMANQTITLNAGWNLLPVLSPCNLDADELLSGISGLIIAYEVAGNGIYYPEMNINTLQTLVPGKSYYIKVQNAVEVTFPACGKNASFGNVLPVRAKNITPWNDPAYSGSSHIVVFDPNATTAFEPGDMIGAFTSDGQCAGLTQVTGISVSMSLFGNDFTSSSKDGFEEGERLTFKLYRNSSNTEYSLEVDYNAKAPNSDGYFTTNGLSVISNMMMSPTVIVSPDQIGLNIYPNPSTGIFTLAVEHENSNMAYVITNSGGQTIAQGNLSASRQIDLSNHPKGVYFIRIAGDNLLNNRKLVVK
ncbi:MAG: carboxypeptidase regulatory-like domain-containing protein [Bacteroidales bacterium]|nr:carboxypeptidase regulatory-like domain-containing protein [Bacteroidales bacterium]